jgi:hypothetical protein
VDHNLFATDTEESFYLAGFIAADGSINQNKSDEPNYFSICLSRKDEKFFPAPEDHYGFIFTLSAYLIEQQINEEIKEDLQKELFKDVINLYCDELFYKLMSCSSAIYSQVGVILANICNFERSYLEVVKPKS